MNVDEHAKSNRGFKTWGFSQSDLLVWRHYRTMGICAALSAHWIKYHAHEDSLANHLGGGGVGPLNVGKLKEIARDHNNLSTMKGISQRDNLELWLQMHGIKTRQQSRMMTNWKKVKVATSSPIRDMDKKSEAGATKLDVCPNIENDMVTSMQKYNSCYVRINFGSQSGGHAVAAWLGQPTFRGSGDACFFDPNYGEYWFEAKADFFKFFPGYYRSKYKSWPMSFDKNWEILPCALGV